MTDTNIPIVYVLRDAPNCYLAKTLSQDTAERLCIEYRSFNKTVWVDLETENGQPHPSLKQEKSVNDLETVDNIISRFDVGIQLLSISEQIGESFKPEN